jgi:hypothetical protein
MNATDCRVVRLEIDGSELGQSLSETGEAHVAVCASCSQFRSERSRLRELIGSLDPVTAPADFDMRLRARIARENQNQAQQPWIFRFVVSTPAIAVAALLVILVGTLVWVNQRSATETFNSASATIPAEGIRTSAQAPAADQKTRTETQPLIATADTSKRNSPRNFSRGFSANAPQASDFNASSAQAIRLTPDRAGEVSLTAPVNPMVVSVPDEHGGTRRILLPPVSFGSQRLTDNRVSVSMNNSRDW